MTRMTPARFANLFRELPRIRKELPRPCECGKSTIGYSPRPYFVTMGNQISACRTFLEACVTAKNMRAYEASRVI